MFNMDELMMKLLSRKLNFMNVYFNTIDRHVHV